MLRPDPHCVAMRVAAPTCTSTGLGAFANCATTIHGEEFGFSTFEYDYDGRSQSCQTDSECIAKDADCNQPGKRCYCEISSYGGIGTPYMHQSTGAACYMVTIANT